MYCDIKEKEFKVSAFVNFISVRWDLGLIDPGYLSKVIVINGAMRQTFGRNKWPRERFVLEVTLPWNEKNGAIKNDNEIRLTSIWRCYR